jgi:hypothetical protein
MHKQPFIWETHGIHVGTGDHVIHGIDDLDSIVEQAVAMGFPSLTFIIHTPRLTRFRYASERATDVKFICGDASYFAFACLTLNGTQEAIREAIEFVLGTTSDRFLRIDTELRIRLPPVKKAAVYLLEVDGVWLSIPIFRHMLITVHSNRPGVLFVLLSALASRNVDVVDLQLGARGEKGFAALRVQGDERDVAELLTQLGPSFLAASQIVSGGLK